MKGRKTDILEVSTHPLTNWLYGAGFLRSWYLVKIFPVFYKNWRYMNIFIRTCHWSITWIKWIRTINLHAVSLRYILVVFTQVCLNFLNGVSLSFTFKIMYSFLNSPLHSICPIHLIILLLTAFIITDFRFSCWLTPDVHSALGCLCYMDVGSVADVLEPYASSISRFTETRSTYTLWPWRWKQHIPLKHRQNYPHSHSIRANCLN